MELSLFPTNQSFHISREALYFFRCLDTVFGNFAKVGQEFLCGKMKEFRGFVPAEVPSLIFFADSIDYLYKFIKKNSPSKLIY